MKAGQGQATWSGEAESRWLMGTAWLVLLVTGLVAGLVPRLVPVHGEASIAFASGIGSGTLVFVLLRMFSIVRVRVDTEKITIRVGGWPNWTMALWVAEIGRVETIDLRPMEWGGWGYRGSLRWFRRAAVVVRGGPAILLHLKSGKRLAVTVDRADAGCEAIRRLLGAAS
jgi:hypothetical protein